MTPEERHALLLRAALLEGDAAREAFAAWRRDLVWDEIDPPTHRLLPLLHRNLLALGVDDPLLPRMRGLSRQTWVLNELRLDDGARAVAALGAAGIPSVLLKGAAMVVRWLGDPGLRLMGDLDLLVRRDDARRAIACLLDAGWRPIAGSTDRFADIDLEREHAAGLRSTSGTDLDLHWRALRQGAGGDAELWARVEPVLLRGEQTNTLAAEDHVYHACAHGSTWAAFGRIDWAADVAVILRRSGPAFDWDRVAALARADHLEVPLGVLLAQMRDTLGTDIPPRVLRRLHLSRPALLDRLEFALRRRRPHELGRFGGAVLTVQDHRRRTGDLAPRSIGAALGSLGARRWLVDGRRAAAGYALYAAAGRPALLRRRLVGRGARRRAVTQAEGEVPTLAPGAVLDLAVAETGLLAGWSFPEPGGRWTDGREAVLALRLDPLPAGDVPVRVDATPFLHAGHPALDVEAWADDVRVATWSFRLGRPCDPEPFVVPRPAIGADGLLVLSLVVRSPARPLAAGLSLDDRLLGLFLRSVQVGRPAVTSAGKAGVDALWEGWSATEDGARWSDGTTAVVRLRAPACDQRPLAVMLEGVPITWPDGASPGIVVRAAGRSLTAGTVGELFSGGCLRVDVPSDAIGAGGEVDLTLELHPVPSPAELGVSDDSRRLGVRVHAVTVGNGR